MTREYVFAIAILLGIALLMGATLYEKRMDNEHEQEMAKRGYCRDGSTGPYKPCAEVK